MLKSTGFFFIQSSPEEALWHEDKQVDFSIWGNCATYLLHFFPLLAHYVLFNLIAQESWNNTNFFFLFSLLTSSIMADIFE